jgi:ribonuclease D
MDDAALRALVHQPPRHAQQLASVPELTSGFIERSGALIMQVIESAALPERLPPPAPRTRPDPELQERVARMSAIVQRRAKELEVAAELLATRRDLEAIARGDADAEVLRGWRRDIVGAQLLAE